MATHKIDHLVVTVPDVDAAIRDCQAAGWPVHVGGKHGRSPTVNAIVPLRGESYIELLAFDRLWVRSLLKRLPMATLTSGRMPNCKRNLLLALLDTPQLAAVCLSTDSINDSVAMLRQAGIDWDQPIDMQRHNSEQLLRWRLAAGPGIAMPFLIEDITPARLRRGEQQGIAELVAIDIQLSSESAKHSAEQVFSYGQETVLKFLATTQVNSKPRVTATLKSDIPLPSCLQHGFRVA